LVTACASGGSDDESEPPAPAAVANGLSAFCDGLCAGMERCNQPIDTCASDCLARMDLNGYQASSLATVGACAKTEDCKRLRLADSTGQCFAQARNDEPLRQTVVDYCEAASLNYFRCDHWWPLDQCATDVDLWQDDVLTRARGCLNLVCDQLFDCIKAQWEQTP
jgi:hypothetical protein